MLLVEGDIAAQTWKESARTGAVVSCTVISIFLIFFFVVPNTYLALKRIKQQPPAFVSKVDWPYKSAKMYKQPAESDPLSESNGPSNVVENVMSKNSKFDMDVIVKGSGPKPSEKEADALESYAKDNGANSTAAWYLSFSLPNAFNTLCASRCKLWDDRELDVFEGAKFLCYILAQLTLTSQFTMNT